jgi:exosome complex RNA-binding protein Rrp4
MVSPQVSIRTVLHASVQIVSSAIEILSTHEMNEAEVLNSSDTIIRDKATLEKVSTEGKEGFEVSTEQLSQLATGDFVKINSEVYKVEIAPEGS